MLTTRSAVAFSKRWQEFRLAQRRDDLAVGGAEFEGAAVEDEHRGLEPGGGHVAVFDRCCGLGEGQTHEFVVGHDSETSEADPVGVAAAGRGSALEWPGPLLARRAIYAPRHGEHA